MRCSACSGRHLRAGRGAPGPPRPEPASLPGRVDLRTPPNREGRRAMRPCRAATAAWSPRMEGRSALGCCCSRRSRSKASRDMATEAVAPAPGATLVAASPPLSRAVRCQVSSPTVPANGEREAGGPVRVDRVGEGLPRETGLDTRAGASGGGQVEAGLREGAQRLVPAAPAANPDVAPEAPHTVIGAREHLRERERVRREVERGHPPRPRLPSGATVAVPAAMSTANVPTSRIVRSYASGPATTAPCAGSRPASSRPPRPDRRGPA